MPERFEANVFSPGANILMKEAFEAAWLKAHLIEYDPALTRQLLASAIIDQVNAGAQDHDQIVSAALAALAVAKNIAKYRARPNRVPAFCVGDDIRKLAAQLAVSSHGRIRAKLNPKSVKITLAALRAYLDKPTSPPATRSIVSFQIEALDNIGLPLEVLATTGDKRIAHATLAKAKECFPDRMITLRGKSSRGERIKPAD